MCSLTRVHVTCSSSTSRPIVRKEVLLTGKLAGIATDHDEISLSEHPTFPGLQRRVASLKADKHFAHGKLRKRLNKGPKFVLDTTSIAVIEVRHIFW